MFRKRGAGKKIGPDKSRARLAWGEKSTGTGSMRRLRRGLVFGSGFQGKGLGQAKADWARWQAVHCVIGLSQEGTPCHPQLHHVLSGTPSGLWRGAVLHTEISRQQPDRLTSTTDSTTQPQPRSDHCLEHATRTSPCHDLATHPN